MSTEILNINDKVWDKEDNSSIKPKTLKQQLSLTRFFGGLEFGGRAIQITIGNEYVLLSPKQAWELGNTLSSCFETNEIFPSQ